jgi:hypothetical protein
MATLTKLITYLNIWLLPNATLLLSQSNQNNGQQPTDLQRWKTTHTKDGQWSNEESRDVYVSACICLQL